MTFRKLLLMVSVLLVACQWGWSQTGQATAPAVSDVVRFAQPFAVMPARSVAPGHLRSHAWIAGLRAPLTRSGATHIQLPGSAPDATNPPGLPCNTAYDGAYPLCPSGLEGAYQMASIVGANGGAGTVIAIVDAYNDPDAASDLNLYSSIFGLPAPNLTILNQNGLPSPLPPDSGNTGWAVEEMLDLESAHSMAPNAKLILVEGNSNSFSDLATAVTTAIGLADVVSNSYGADEFSGETTLDGTYSAANKPVFFSSGDGGIQEYPCASPYVTCVGGTDLYVNANPPYQRTNETGWSDSGGGCSSQETKPAFQTTYGVSLCSPWRSMPDIAADADPATGLWEIDDYDYPNEFILVGGTSLACPLTAAIFADIDAARVSFGKAKLGGPGGGISLDPDVYKAFKANFPYFYYDVTSGCNGEGCAGVGYDLVTGIGVSNGPDLGNRFFGLP